MKFCIDKTSQLLKVTFFHEINFTKIFVKKIFTKKNLASCRRSSPPAIASICSSVISSAASIPDIFRTTSLRMSKSRLRLLFNWLATYCKIPVSSILYFLNMAPQKLDSDWSQREMLVPSCLVRSFSGLFKASIIEYPRTSKDKLVRYLSESTTGPIRLSYSWIWDNT